MLKERQKRWKNMMKMIDKELELGNESENENT